MFKQNAAILRFSMVSTLVLFLSSCGEQESAQLKEKIIIGAGKFERNSIVERDQAIADDQKVGHIERSNYFPSSLPKLNADLTSRFGQDIFWTFAPGTRFGIKADPQKILLDGLLLEAELFAGQSNPMASFYHDEFATFAEVSDDWRVEFQPHLRIRGAASGTAVQLKLNELWVCSKKETNNTITILSEQRREFKSDILSMKNTFQDLKLAFEVSKAFYLNFKGSCESLQGRVAHNLEFSVVGAENETRTIQFVELRMINEQLF